MQYSKIASLSVTALVLSHVVFAAGDAANTKVSVTTAVNESAAPSKPEPSPANATATANAQVVAAPTPAPAVEASAKDVREAKEIKEAREAESAASGHTTNIQNNNITLGQPSVITVAPASPAPAAPAVAYKGQDEVTATTVLGTKMTEKETAREDKVAILPMFGTSGFTGDWYGHVSNSYTFGLGVEFPITHNFSIETEGGMSRYNISYGNPFDPSQMPLGHYFNQYHLGGNLKIYLAKTWIRPYVGAGLMGIYYENMSYGFGQNPLLGRMGSYNQWLGAGQAIVGADVPVGGGVALGARGAWVLPLFNRPTTQDNGAFAMPGYEEAALMSTSMYKVMGTVSVSF